MMIFGGLWLSSIWGREMVKRDLNKLDKRKKVVLKMGGMKKTIQRVNEKEVIDEGLYELGSGAGMCVEYCAWMGKKYCEGFMDKVKYFQIVSQLKESKPIENKFILPNTIVKFYADGGEEKTINHLEMSIIVRDLMTSEVEFFKNESESKKFCEKRDIEKMPLESNLKEYMQFDKGKKMFRKKRIFDSDLISPNLNIVNFIEKTKKKDLFFVSDGREIIGVIHYCDLINSVAYVYFYALFNLFEKRLREGLIYAKCSNKDLLDWLKEKSEEGEKKAEDYEKRIKETKLPPFQHIDFRDLLSFCYGAGIIPENPKIKPKNELDFLARLRNNLMHNKDLSCRQDRENNEMLYERKDYDRFLKAYYKIKELNKKLGEKNGK